MVNREAERFDYNSINNSDLDPEEVYVEFEFLDNIRGSIVDISLKGVGFEIADISDEKGKILSEEKDYFLKIHAGEEFFLAGVQNRWYVVEKGQKGLVFKGGVEIQILSPEDSVRLNGLIASLRRVSPRG